jgi:tRNA pseudouridine38-40 synthase
MRYFFHIAYKGTNYNGWQRQKTGLSIQEVLETELQQILRQNISCMGCGRTDAGVHAGQYFFHSDIDRDWEMDLLFVLNKKLPDDIVVYDILPMQGWPHAQKDALSRTYDYFIHTRANPFWSEISAFYPLESFSAEKIRTATQLIPNFTDFRAFCKTPDRHAHTLCEVKEANFWMDEKKERLRFQFSANRFLKGMVRLLVGNLLEVGQGRMSVEEFEHHLASGEAPKFMNLADPQGLYLSKVEYSFDTGHAGGTGIF